MRQIYYSIIYPYIFYAILAWGSGYKSHIKKIQTKQNHAIRLIFFARTLGKSTESALPLRYVQKRTQQQKWQKCQNFANNNLEANANEKT